MFSCQSLRQPRGSESHVLCPSPRTPGPAWRSLTSAAEVLPLSFLFLPDERWRERRQALAGAGWEGVGSAPRPGVGSDCSCPQRTRRPWRSC